MIPCAVIIFVLLMGFSAVDIPTTTIAPLPPLECFLPACPFEVKPICATNGVTYKHFNSECQLKFYNCAHNKSSFYQVDLPLCENKPTHAEACNKQCNREISLICAVDGHIHKLFRNECEKEQQECLSGFKWQKTDLEVCREKKECQEHCSSLVEARVCGYNGIRYQMFTNLCQMEAFNCRPNTEKWREVSTCKCDYTEEALNIRCNLQCPTVYDPVCAADRDRKKTFNSPCELATYNCKNCANFTIISTSTCKEHFNW